MFYSDTESIRIKINRAGALKKSFLFGINFEMTEGFYLENPLHQSDIFFEIRGLGNKSIRRDISPNVQLKSFPIEYDEYRSKFEIVHKGLRRGDSFLTNLTVMTPIQTNLSLEEIFILSNSDYQLYIPDRFVCFSPERFVRIKNGIISSNPMKGTINAHIPNAKEIILHDFKESAEHATIVDLIRNDLSMVAENIHVNKYRYIDQIISNDKSLLQVSSEIEGVLPCTYQSHLGDILFRLLPAGSICGAPKKATIDLIKSAEKTDRNYYTGIFGYYDGEMLDTGVLIRYIEKSDNELYFRSGGGITAYSKCEDEYQEVLTKIYLPFL
jgi:para-aminobenzoate synthetase component 1